MDQQLSFSDAEFTQKRRQTRKEIFLARMDKLIPWHRLEIIIEPYYPKPGNGRRPYPLPTMLRIHCLQQWYSLSDPAMEDALYEIASMRLFTGLSLDVYKRQFIPRPAPSSRVSKYPFITVSENRWEIRSGHWKINDYLVTSDNWHVVVQPDTTLEFSSDAGLMVFGGLSVNGTKKKPVHFTRQANSSSWSGLTVFGTDSVKNSNINNLEISYGKSPKLAFWQPRGAAYFINSKLTANHLTVRDNFSEDALNVINSQIDLNHLNILNTLSDGFDCDFCQGTISNSQFTNTGSVSGGDGLDTSGSTIQVSNSQFNQVRDKAISAGEHSRLSIYNSTVKNSNIAIVAKDRSEVTASKISLENIKEFSFMSYTKKPIFGSATLYASDVVCAQFDCASKALVEKGSSLLIDGKPVTGEQVNVKALYQGIMKSDKPK